MAVGIQQLPPGTSSRTERGDWRGPRRARSAGTCSADTPAKSLVPKLAASRMLGLVINLARRKDRLARMRELRLPFDWQRLEAIDGRTLSWAKLQSDGLLHADAVKEAKWAEARAVPTICMRTNSFSPHLTLGGVGTALSHRKAWHELLASPAATEYALIMEDDVCAVAADLEVQLRRLLAQLPSTWHVIFLGYHESSGRLLAASHRPRHMELPRGPAVTGLFGYLVHRRGAHALLQPEAGIFPLRRQVDVAVSQYPWPTQSRFVVDPQAVLIASPKSEEGACDTDVQTLGKPHESAHAAMPSSMLLL